MLVLALAPGPMALAAESSVASAAAEPQASTAEPQMVASQPQPLNAVQPQAATARPSFIEMFRPLYFTGGFPVSERPDKNNADLKFQLSLAIPIWRNIGGSGIDLLAAYTQISLWNFFARSSPFYENTYIPGFYARKAWLSEEGKPVRTLLWGYEHRSNGRDDAYSRSINYLLVSYTRSFYFGLHLQAAARLGQGFYGDVATWDIYSKYFGPLQLSATYTTPDEGWEFMLSATPIWNKSIANVNVEVGRRIASRKAGNPYFFVQFHYGYDEAFRDCIDVNGPVVEAENKVPYLNGEPAPPRAFVRFGILVTPKSVMRGNL